MGTPNNPVSSGVAPPTVPGSPTAPAVSVTFSLQGVQPPSRVYITRDDQMFIQCMSSQGGETVIVRYRILLPNGSISTNEQRIVLPTAYVSNSVTPFFAVAEGFLLSLAAICTTANKRGMTWVRVGLARAGASLQSPIETLLAEYVTNQQPVSWPEGRVLDPVEGPGNLRAIAVGNPAAGADINLVQPANTRWLLREFLATLTTAAAVANRNPRLVLTDGISGLISEIPSQADQAASLVETYSLSGASVASTAASLANSWAAQAGLYAQNTGAIRTSTANIQAADQWSAIIITVEEWLVGV